MASHIGRRKFLATLGGAAAWPLAARAEPSDQMRRVGVLMNGAETDPVNQSWLAAFVQAFKNLGWDGQNVRIDLRWSAGDAERARTYAAELIGLRPDVILTASSLNLTSTQRATTTIPIVFTLVSDPIAQGFVSNLPHPGGNVTGFTNYEVSIGGKWLDLLKQIAPGIARVAVMFNPDTSPQSRFFVSSVEAAAPSFGVHATAVPVRDTADIEPAIVGFSRQPNGGLIFPTDTFTFLRRNLIVDLAARYRLPAIYAYREFTEAGGLMRYSADDYHDQFRQAASYVDRILKGAKPGDLPIQQPTKYALSINLKAARALGIDVPMGLLLRTDEVIE